LISPGQVISALLADWPASSIATRHVPSIDGRIRYRVSGPANGTIVLAADCASQTRILRRFNEARQRVACGN
jgi:hypothetical protein